VTVTDIRVLRRDAVHLHVSAAGLMVMSTKDERYWRISVSGELDISSVAAYDLVAAHTVELGPPCLDVDIAALRFLSVAGVAAFESSRQQAERRGGWMQLRNAGAGARRVLAMVGCASLLAPE
jgi:anti-anti-sigma factor